MELKLFIFIHILCATVWTGGHLILLIGFLPKALKQNNFDIIEQFESKFEPIGIPALVLLVFTGLRIAYLYVPDFNWLNVEQHFPKHITIKLVLLVSTILLALHARLKLIPARKLKSLAIHIALVTLLSIVFVFVGFSARSGGLL